MHTTVILQNCVSLDQWFEVRDATKGLVPPSCTPAPPGYSFRSFSVTTDAVPSEINKLPNKSSACGPFPTNLLKDCIDILAPFIAHLFNVSLSSGIFPSAWKRAYITSVPKKRKIDASSVRAYRPISNLPVLSKVLERLVSSACQLRFHLGTNNLMPSTQSAYRPHHSTETAILKLSSDILNSLDRGNIGLMCFLDLSAAFDTVDHSVLSNRLRASFGLHGRAAVAAILPVRSPSVREIWCDNVSVHSCDLWRPARLSSGALALHYTVDLVDLARSNGLLLHS